jgi:DNA-binding response OmpR family regulator
MQQPAPGGDRRSGLFNSQRFTAAGAGGLLVSSSDAERDRTDAVRLGASRYIRKPTRLDEFLSLEAIFKAALLEPKR